MSIQFAFTKEYEQQVVDSVLEHIEGLIDFILDDDKVDESIATEFFIAGGSIVSTIIGTGVNDIDIYPKTVRAAKAIAEWASSSSHVSASTKSLYCTVGGGTDVNLVVFQEFKTADDIFKGFDFSCVMVAIDMATKSLVYGDGFLEAIISRNVKVNTSTRYPIISLQRVKKYQGRGFYFAEIEVAKLIAKVSMLRMTTVDEIREQISGYYGASNEGVVEMYCGLYGVAYDGRNMRVIAMSGLGITTTQNMRTMSNIYQRLEY